jgi:hypothetical protein
MFVKTDCHFLRDLVAVTGVTLVSLQRSEIQWFWNTHFWRDHSRRCWFLSEGFRNGSLLKSIDKFATLGCNLARAFSDPLKCVRFVVDS